MDSTDGWMDGFTFLDGRNFIISTYAGHDSIRISRILRCSSLPDYLLSLFNSGYVLWSLFVRFPSSLRFCNDLPGLGFLPFFLLDFLDIVDCVFVPVLRVIVD
jgi:hypothetical protein